MYTKLAFLIGVFMDFEFKTIYCPICGRKVGKYNLRSTMNVTCRCMKCNKRVIYDYQTGKTSVKKMPERFSSGAKMFV